MSKGRVLVIDDDPIVLAVVEERLEDNGYEVVTHSSTIGVSQVIEASTPEIILLDVIMPGVRGDEMAKLLGRSDGSREVPIILHSSKSEGELEQLVRDTGAIGAIPKTDSAEAFIGQFEALLRVAVGRSSQF